MEKPDKELEGMLTDLDPPYETTNELKIGRTLDQYGIPFFYKQPTIVYNDGKNELWKPSFTMYSYGGAVIDYIQNTEGSQDQLLSRDKIYRYNQIPAMLLGPRDLDKSNWEEGLYERLEQMYLKAVDPMRYVSTSTDQQGQCSK